MQILAGTSGWQYKEWKGSFYPGDLATDGMLAYYAERFPTVEVNNTFYRLPRENVLRGWAEAVPDGFVFVLKASQRITHHARLGDRAADPLAYLLTAAASLGDRLGPILFQLPPNLKKDVARLESFLARVPAGTRGAFEFRHPSWHDDDVLGLLRAHDMALCVVSTGDGAEAGAGSGHEAEAAPEPALRATAGYGYLRLRKEEYGDGELEAWAERILAQPWSEAFVFFKHEDEGTGPKLARRFLDICAGRDRPGAVRQPS